ncbi:MAG TPA: hypothetical protein VII28_16665 [Puia sp.]
MKYKNGFLKLMVMLVFIPSFMKGQTVTAKNFFNSDTVTAVYLGIDFTLTRLINDEASNPTVIQSQQFNGINYLIIKENKKYDVQEAYHRLNWIVNLKAVEARNMKADPDQLKSSNEGDLTRLKKSAIDSLVSKFDFGNQKGYGILLIVEGLSKSSKLATIWFNLINMGEAKVLVTQRVNGKLGSGFGFRNYWASAIKNAIGEVKHTYYDQWKSGAGSQ